MWLRDPEFQYSPSHVFVYNAKYKNISFNARDFQNLKRLALGNNNKLTLNKNNEKKSNLKTIIFYI